MSEKVAILGLGAMGSRMAERLISAGYELTVYNRDPSRSVALSAQGATVASSPRRAAEGADIVLSMVRDDAASCAIWLSEQEGALRGLSDEALAIECSTVSVAWIQKLAGRMEKEQKCMIEAPVLGSRPSARAGELIVLSAGPEKLCERALPFFAHLAKQTLFLGSTGRAVAMKLCVNSILAVQVAAWAEALAFLSTQGFNDSQAVSALRDLPITSAAARGVLDRTAEGRFDPQFPVELVEKDLALLLSGVGPTRPVVDATAAVFRRAIEHGLGAENLNAVRKLY